MASYCVPINDYFGLCRWVFVRLGRTGGPLQPSYIPKTPRMTQIEAVNLRKDSDLSEHNRSFPRGSFSRESVPSPFQNPM